MHTVACDEPDCGRVFTNTKSLVLATLSLRRHQTAAHPDKYPRKEKTMGEFTCPVDECGRTFKQKMHLARHTATKHATANPAKATRRPTGAPSLQASARAKAPEFSLNEHLRKMAADHEVLEVAVNDLLAEVRIIRREHAESSKLLERLRNVLTAKEREKAFAA